MQDEPKWRRFELLAKQIQEQLSPDSVVRHNEMVMGRSGTKRQVDISVRTKIGQFEIFIALECKDYNKPINMKTVEEFAGLLEDVQATKGAIITYHGFSSSARRVAAIKGIDLYRLIDTQSVEWPVVLKVPVVCNTRGLKNYQLRFSSSYDSPFIMSAEEDVRQIAIYNEKSELIGKIEDYLRKLWNNGSLTAEEGKYEYKLTKVYMQHNNAHYPVDISYDYEVSGKYYISDLAISNLMGFLDEKTGGIITNQLVVSGYIDIEEVESKWHEVSEEEIESINYLFMFVAIEGYYRKQVRSELDLQNPQ